MTMETVMKQNQPKRRSNGLWIALLAGAVALSGCGAVGAGAPKSSSFVLSEDVQADIRSMESTLLDGQLLSLEEELPHSDILSIKNGVMLFNKKQGFYTVNIEGDSNESPQQLLDVPAIVVSEDGGKALYEQESSLYVLDILSGESKEVQLQSSEPYEEEKDSPFDHSNLHFGDREGRYVIIPRKPGVITIADTATDKAKTLMLEKYIQSHSYGYVNDFKVFQNEFYISLNIGGSMQKNLYKINLDNDQFEPVLVSDNMHMWGYQVLSDGTLLFNGQYQDEDGIFMYDPVTGTSTTLIGEKDTDEGRLNYAFSLSPDESRIIIDDVVDNNVAIADLKDGKLSNKRFIMKGYYLSAVIWLLDSWDEDGNDVYIKLSYGEGGTFPGAVSSIAKFKTSQ